MLNFEVFAKRMVPVAKKPYVTIQRSGLISLNAAARAALASPAAVELMFDVTERVIGLRGVAPDSDNAFPLRAQGGKQVGPYLVSGRAFLAHYGVDTTVSRRWVAELVDDILCVDLKAEGATVTSNRSATSPGAGETAEGHPPHEPGEWPGWRPQAAPHRQDGR